MKSPFIRKPMHTGATTTAQSHLMSFLTFRKIRTAANVIQRFKNPSNPNMDSLSVYDVLSEAVP
jgi:hypothetical protein